MNCKEGAIELIDQIIHTIALIPENDYSRELDVFNGSTLGKHFRHIYDFFHCLVEQCACHKVDYAQRTRESIIENDPFFVREKFEQLKKEISPLNEDLPMDVYADFHLSDGNRPKVASTIGRELMYAYDHAVHHLAIVKIGIQSLQANIALDKNLGVAASTIQHQYEVNHGH